jgi:putative membrane protein insertion efficiency factor
MEPVRPRRRLKKWWTAAAAVCLLLALDFARPPRDQLSARALLGAIHLYQATLSPHMGELGVRCRFTPTCSHYGEGAIRKYGAWKGSWLAAWRILRCGPWTPAGTFDPP